MLSAAQKKQLKRIRELRWGADTREQADALLDALDDPVLKLVAGLEGPPEEASTAVEHAPSDVLDAFADTLRLRPESFQRLGIPALDANARDFVSLELNVKGWPQTRAFDYIRDRAALMILGKCPRHRRVKDIAGQVTHLFVNGSANRRVGTRHPLPTSMDLRGLNALTSLQRLVLIQMENARSASIAALDQLREVILFGCIHGSVHLDAPHLQSVIAIDGGPTVVGLDKALALRTLRVQNYGLRRYEYALHHLHELEVIDVAHPWPAEFTEMNSTASMPRLHTLRVSDVRQVAALRSHPALQEAHLPRVEDIAPLAAIPTLRHLELPRGRFTSLQAWSARELPALEHLDLTGGQIDSLEGIQGCTQLRTLVARSTRLTDVSALRDHPTIEEVILENASQLRSVKEMGCPPRLKRLALSRSKVTSSRVADEALQFVEPQSLVAKRLARR